MTVTEVVLQLILSFYTVFDTPCFSQIDDALMLQFDSLIHLNLQNNSITEIKISVGKILTYTVLVQNIKLTTC